MKQKTKETLQVIATGIFLAIVNPASIVVAIAYLTKPHLF